MSSSQNVQTLTKENYFKTDIRVNKTWFMVPKIKQFMCDQHDLNEVKFGLSEKHTKFEKIFLKVLTNQLIYLIYIKTMRNIFSNYMCFSKSPNFILQSFRQWKLPNGSIYLFNDLFWFDVFLQFATKIYISSEEILNWQNYVLNVFFFRNFNFLKLKVKNGATEFFCSSFVINSFLCVVYG